MVIEPSIKNIAAVLFLAAIGAPAAFNFIIFNHEGDLGGFP